MKVTHKKNIATRSENNRLPPSLIDVRCVPSNWQRGSMRGTVTATACHLLKLLSQPYDARRKKGNIQNSYTWHVFSRISSIIFLLNHLYSLIINNSKHLNGSLIDLINYFVPLADFIAVIVDDHKNRKSK